MTPALDAEQTTLRDTLRALLSKYSSSAHIRTAIGTSAGYDTGLWRQLVRDLGLTAIGIPEEYGGTRANIVDLAVAAEELGRALTPAPFLSCAIAIQLLLAADAASTHVPALVGGTATATVALVEQSGDWSMGGQSTTARFVGGAWLVSGAKSFVTDAAVADLFLVRAQTPDGATIFAVRRGDEVSFVDSNALDPTRRLSTLRLRDAPGEIIGDVGAADAILERFLPVAAVVIACEQLGGAERCLDMAVDHAKTRHQFGRPIGSFQAIKHLLADRLLDNRSAAAATYAAARAADRPGREFHALAGLCKSVASEAFLAAAKANVQVHGAIGFTWEHDAHLYLKRAIGSRVFFGSPEYHREKIASHLFGPPQEDR